MLTHETVEKIGYLIGMPYTNYNDKTNIPDDVSDGEFCMSGKATLVNGIDSIPPLLIFTGLVSSFQYGNNNKTNSIYVLNLNTLKPTKKSYRQTEIPVELQKIIRNELSSIE